MLALDRASLMSEPDATPFEQADGRPILLVHAPAKGRQLVERLRGRRPLFVCTVAHTETAEIDGLSGAGATAELRRLTAAADVEALEHGHPLCMDGVPSNPNGAPGPVIITLAGLRMAGLEHVSIDAGLRVKPQAATMVVADRWGASILTGRAVPHAPDLFARGLALAPELAARGDYLVLAESVPGGTTTALALLCGLGIDAWGRVSSSMPENAHPLKTRVVQAALAAAGLDSGRASASALDVAAAVGDPMQPFVAGLALGALPRCPVLLAGGSQMAAVLALIVALARERGDDLDLDRIGIATTSWVARDPTADLAGLVAQIADVPVLASSLSFARSRHAPLRRYEDFLVKEGVGAGAAAVVASLVTDADHATLLAAVERVYEEIYGLDVAAS
ncbi:MAG: TIGR00303 family protein [Chloroflexota bacterium]